MDSIILIMIVILMVQYGRIILFPLIQPGFFSRNIKGKEHQDHRQRIQEYTDDDIPENFLLCFFL
jgi:hypothetical protein